jgi:competence protein ComEC
VPCAPAGASGSALAATRTRRIRGAPEAQSGVMISAVLAFACGVWWLQQQAALPDPRSLWALFAGAVALAALAAWLERGARPAWPALALAALLGGFGYAALRAELRLADQLATQSEGRDVRLVGVVVGLPQSFERGLRFDFEVEQADAAVPRRISMAWYGAPPGAVEGEGEEADGGTAARLHAGERWALLVRLKRPHGSINPHGVDYEAWLLERGIRATGYVRARAENRRLDAFVLRPDTLVERIRERVRERFRAALPDAPYAGVLIALAIGDQRAIDAAQWELFARSGITHLVSISGLHVTMVAALAMLLASALWRRVPGLALRLPAQQAGIACGWLAALAYTLLAGFGVPAQRTLYMLSVVALALWLRRGASAAPTLALALLAVLLLDPWAVIAPGFWLSFGAVALLFYAGSGRIAAGHWLSDWGRAQWAVTLGLIPALLALFQQFSLVSPIANAVAIPLVSLVVTPLALMAVVLPSQPLLALAHALLAGLMTLLEWLAAPSWAMWQQAAPPPWTIPMAILGCVWLLLPAGFPARWLGALLLLPLATIAPPRPAPGELRLTVLDVGQGLAVHVQSAAHDLLYDAGPQYSREANSGNRIILPYLRALGVRRLDGMVVSHRDRDHAGGAQSVLDGLPVGWLSSSLPAEDALRAVQVAPRRCVAGERWEWDGVRFEFLHPRAADYETPAVSDNDLSCVLRVGAGERSVLLAGDIGTAVEARLAATPGLLQADYLVAPHHGSRGSSSRAFVAAVGAREVIFTAGYRNRFRHPHLEVAARYAAAGARLLRTDRDGAVTLRVGALGSATELERERAQRYWHG